MPYPSDVAHWIFVAGPRNALRRRYRDLPRPEESLRVRIDAGYWPLGTSTKGAHRLASGDQVIFYLAGEGNRAFVGQAEVASAPQPLEEIVPESADVFEPEMPLAVRLTRIRVWPKRVSVEPLASTLRFLRATIESRSGSDRKNAWSSRFAVGLLSIRESDCSSDLGYEHLPHEPSCPSGLAIRPRDFPPVQGLGDLVQ